MQIVTRCFGAIYRRLGHRGRDGKGRRGPSSAHLKREAHRRHRGEVRRYLTHQDWDGDVVASRPVTSWDAF